jgi:hypothetical protein
LVSVAEIELGGAYLAPREIALDGVDVAKTREGHARHRSNGKVSDLKQHLATACGADRADAGIEAGCLALHGAE